MKKSLFVVAFLGIFSLLSAESAAAVNAPKTQPVEPQEITVKVVDPIVLKDDKKDMTGSVNGVKEDSLVLHKKEDLRITVVGQGVAPVNTSSPAQAYALAKRAAVADAYRLIAEKVKGVRVDGQDLIKNMMVKRSIVRTSINAMVRNANIVETTFKEGLCEVEMDIVLSYSQFAQ